MFSMARCVLDHWLAVCRIEEVVVRDGVTDFLFTRLQFICHKQHAV